MKVADIVAEIERMNANYPSVALQTLRKWIISQQSKRVVYWREYKRRKRVVELSRPEMLQKKYRERLDKDKIRRAMK